jgi:hypothetical protein
MCNQEGKESCLPNNASRRNLDSEKVLVLFFASRTEALFNPALLACGTHDKATGSMTKRTARDTQKRAYNRVNFGQVGIREGYTSFGIEEVSRRK